MQKSLNLAYPEKSDIVFKISKFPDGQQNITLEGFFDVGDIREHELMQKIRHLSGPIGIKARFNNFQDFELIACAVSALKELGITRIDLYIPYLLGARSDRKFQEGQNVYLPDVIAPALASLGVNRIYCMDVHNGPVARACIRNIVLLNNADLTRNTLSTYANQYNKDYNKKLVLIAPDEGAGKKIFDLAKEVVYSGNILECKKKRDLITGEILSTDIGNVVDFKGDDVLIIDDICDGGRTFIEIAKRAKLLGCGKLMLQVTHGIFSNGAINKLLEYFDNIYTTNSYSEGPDTTNVKYFNVF